jgi:hypothetical protein
MFQINLQTLFDEHKADGASSKRRLKAYRDKSPSVTLEDSFNISYFNQYEIGPSGEVQEVQSSSPINLRGGEDTIEEVVDEQTITQVEG